VFTSQSAQADRQRILELYARRGRFGAVVEPKVIELEQNRVDVVYEIQENEAALVARINFVGNGAYSDSRLKEVVATKEQAWYRIFSSSDQFDPERLAFDRELLRRFYLRSGYADVQVSGATAELAPDRSGFFVTYSLDEGARYRVGRVEVVSNIRNLDPATLRGLVQVEEGDWYDGDAVERVSQSLQDAVNLRGFPFVDVQPRIQRDRAAGRVDLTFEVNEAPRVFVERIEISGNTRTQDRVIRREFRLAEGDAFNAAQIRRSRQRIRDLGYFSDVQVTSSPGSAPDRAVLNTSVTERATGEVSSAAATPPTRARWRTWACASATCSAPASTRASTARSPSGAARWTSRSPTRPSSTATSPPASTSSTSSATSSRSPTTASAGRLRGARGYAFNERLRRPGPTPSPTARSSTSRHASRFVREQQGETLLSQIGQTISYDFRDSIIDPRRGGVVRLGTDFAGLGGDVTYVRARLDGTYFFPLESYLGDPDWVLSVSGSVGYLETLGREDRIVDRFFLGGENLRGFRIAGTGPRVALSAAERQSLIRELGPVAGAAEADRRDTRDSLGGRFLWTQSTELRYPLPLPAELGLIGRAFVDVGSLSRSESGSACATTPARASAPASASRGAAPSASSTSTWPRPW
jgi:outer membrane protein insertion porin family